METARHIVRPTTSELVLGVSGDGCGTMDIRLTFKSCVATAITQSSTERLASSRVIHIVRPTGRSNYYDSNQSALHAEGEEETQAERSRSRRRPFIPSQFRLLV